MFFAAETLREASPGVTDRLRSRRVVFYLGNKLAFPSGSCSCTELALLHLVRIRSRISLALVRALAVTDVFSFAEYFNLERSIKQALSLLLLWDPV